MKYLCVAGSKHVDSWSANASVTDILVGKMVIHGITEITQHFVIGLTCDVIVDGKVKFRMAV